MIAKRKILVIILVASFLFVVSTNYLLIRLNALPEENLVIQCSVHKEIYKHLSQLPEHYKLEFEATPFSIQIQPKAPADLKETWRLASSWVSKSGIVNVHSPHLGSLFAAMKTANIIKADVDTRGTQLKLLLTLEGGQEVIFKPKWYEIDWIVEGPVYAGNDRWGSEVIGFYLSAMLDMPFTPVSVARVISLKHEIVPVATARLLETVLPKNNRTCLYGKCYYCTKDKPVCDDAQFSLPGAVILNMNISLKSYSSPWQRTYKKNKKAVWESSNSYCKTVKSKLSKRRILDLIDASIFDFLIQNGDRHHYETLHDNVILLDNGKGFGNPNVQHLDILAPLYQCCSLRSTTLKKLKNLAGGNLRKSLENLPDVEKLITKAHLKAIEDRLLIVFATIEYCRNRSNNNNNKPS